MLIIVGNKMFIPNIKTSKFMLSLTALLVFGCGDNNSKVPNPEPVVPPSEENSPASQFPEGVWVQLGFGRAIKVTGDIIDIYDYTRETCLLERNTTQRELASLLTVDSVDVDGFIATEDAGILAFSKRDSMPPACLDNRLIIEYEPVSTLNHIIHNFNDYYPFFELRGILDWEERVSTARAQVHSLTTDEELLTILITLLSGLNDGHVTITAGDDFEYTPASTDGTFIDIFELGFINQSETIDFNDYLSSQFKIMGDIRDSYFDPDSLKMTGGESQDVFQWATIGNGVIGYLEINGMPGISQGMTENDVTATEELMDSILTDLAHTEALIINVMFNGGGDLAVADAIASRFSTEKVIVSAYEAITYDDFLTPQRTPRIHRELAPTERVSYNRPIATISGPNTYSAAEHFLLSMRALKHPVCFIGEPSDGILSAILDKQLPTEDVSLGLSNMIIYDHTGQSFEAVGVPVDIESTTFEVVDSNSERSGAIDAAMTALGFGYLVNQSAPAADCAFVDARTRLESSAP